MFKKLVFATFFITLMCVTTTIFAYDVPEMIRVGLSFDNEAVNSFEVTVEGGAVVGHVLDYDFVPHFKINSSKMLVEKGGGAYLRTKNTYDKVEDALDDAQKFSTRDANAYVGYIDKQYYVLFGIYDSQDDAKNAIEELGYTNLDLVPISLDTKAVMVTADEFCLVFRDESEMFAIGSAQQKTLSTGGRKYYGYIAADRIHTDKIAIINLVATDDYVACVVGSEMYSTWHIEALKAQAVIARTYAMTTTSYKKYGIDVTDDTRSQAYNGLSSETPSTRRAADETAGLILLYKDKPAQTFFHASSGGKTADVYSAWGGGAGLDYLKSVEDTYENSEKYALWSATYTADEIKNKLAKAGINIGNITNVVVTERGDDDERVRKLRFDGTDGSHSVTFEKCRTLLGLKSQYYYIRGASTSAEEKKVSVLTGSGTKQIYINKSSVLGANGTKLLPYSASVISAFETMILNRTNDEHQNTPSGSFTFEGRGHGHGIGLSQYGAKGMAEAGFSYDEILMHYYNGTSLSK